jgi:hypothetical protein
MLKDIALAVIIYTSNELLPMCLVGYGVEHWVRFRALQDLWHHLLNGQESEPIEETFRGYKNSVF